MVIRQVTVITVKRNGLRTINDRQRGIRLAALHTGPDVNAGRVCISIGRFVHLIGHGLANFVNRNAIFNGAVGVRHAILLRLRVAVILSMDVACPTVVHARLPVGLLFGIKLSIKGYTPIIHGAPLHRESFGRILLAILTVIGVPLLVRRDLIRQCILNYKGDTCDRALVGYNDSAIVSEDYGLMACHGFYVKEISDANRMVSFDARHHRVIYRAHANYERRSKVAVEANRLRAYRSVLLDPLFLTRHRRFLRVVNDERYNAPLGYARDRIKDHFVDVNQDVINEISTVITSNRIARSRGTARSDLTLNARVRTDPLRKRSRISGIVIRVRIVNEDDRTLRLAVRGTTARVRMDHVVMLHFKRRPFVSR